MTKDQQLLQLLTEAKENNLKLTGDWLNGFFFIGENKEYFQQKAENICDGTGMNLLSVISESEIEIVSEGGNK